MTNKKSTVPTGTTGSLYGGITGTTNWNVNSTISSNIKHMPMDEVISLLYQIKEIFCIIPPDEKYDNEPALDEAYKEYEKVLKKSFVSEELQTAYEKFIIIEKLINGKDTHK